MMVGSVTGSDILFKSLSLPAQFYNVLLFIILVFFSFKGYSQNSGEYEEVPVTFEVRNVGRTEMTVMIRGQSAYLPVATLFNYLKIWNTPSADGKTISGYYISRTAGFVIDANKMQIVFRNETIAATDNAIIISESTLYLRSDLFKRIFGLNCDFSFHKLSIVLIPDRELPLLMEKLRNDMRNNLHSLLKEESADTLIKQQYPLFGYGVADWSVNATQRDGKVSDYRFRLGLGGQVGGGETSLYLNYNYKGSFKESEQYYLWRRVNNSNPFLRQIIAGRINTNAVSSIYYPVNGIQLTNSLTGHRQSFGSYTISNYTQPGWTVELYINNTLISYTKADASGFYTLNVPLIYGSSAVRLLFYSEWGEEQRKEKTLVIPYSFLPSKELEYTFSIGLVADGHQSRFSRARVLYGLSNYITIGAGAEYLSSVGSGSPMPFMNAAVKMFPDMMLSVDYNQGVRSKVSLIYLNHPGLQVELSEILYKKGQQAVYNNYLEERKASISIPFRGNNFSAYLRHTFNQIKLPSARYTLSEWQLSGVSRKISANINTTATFINNLRPGVYSNFSFSRLFSGGLSLNPQFRYDYSNRQLISFNLEIQKRFAAHGFAGISYERRISAPERSLEFRFQYEFSFVRVSSVSRMSKGTSMLTQSAGGSLLYARKTRYIKAGNQTGVGKGGVIITAFLDINGNGKQDRGEPKIKGMKVRINGGNLYEIKRDSSVVISDLVPYKSYVIEFKEDNFESIAWKVLKPSMQIIAIANQFTEIVVPVAVLGEVSGTVIFGKRDAGRIPLEIYNSSSVREGSTSTDEDGNFYYSGLLPGVYTIKPGNDYLKKKNLLSFPESSRFKIAGKREGDVAEGIIFKLIKAE